MRRSLGILTGSRSRGCGRGMAVRWRARPAAASLIRDAETEGVLRGSPIRSSPRPGSIPNSIDIYIINDHKLNAFVAGGQNLFINTGPDPAAETPEELAGVIAHETGHIAGGHLSRCAAGAAECRHQHDRRACCWVRRPRWRVRPQLGTALMAGGATVAQRGLLKFSRAPGAGGRPGGGHLSCARLRCRREGLLEFFHVLETQNLRISAGRQRVSAHPPADPRADRVPGAAGGRVALRDAAGGPDARRGLRAQSWPSSTAFCRTRRR